MCTGEKEARVSVSVSACVCVMLFSFTLLRMLISGTACYSVSLNDSTCTGTQHNQSTPLCISMSTNM